MSHTSSHNGGAKRPSNNRNLPLGLVRRFSRETKGSTAIEFGLLAVPFIALMFAVLESSLAFGTQQLLANATDRISRDVRTGRLRVADLNGSKLKNLVCARISLMAPTGCPDLIVDLKTYANFAAVPSTIPLTGSGDIDASGFAVNPGPAGSVNHMRVFYRFPVLTDFMRKHMSNMPGNKTLLLATATWRNEPFEL
jgi:Flp pilus assembly protein TadG